MNILYERIKKIYLGLFFLNPKLLSTIIFIPFLYICGWIFATPIFLLGVDKENLSLIGTIFTFFLYLFSLPKWFKLRWGVNNTWTLLGINKKDKKILKHLDKILKKYFERYEVPSSISFLNKLPINSNGKLDKVKLAEIIKK